jgi:hypothetical protein
VIFASLLQGLLYSVRRLSYRTFVLERLLG